MRRTVTFGLARASSVRVAFEVRPWLDQTGAVSAEFRPALLNLCRFRLHRGRFDQIWGGFDQMGPLLTSAWPDPGLIMLIEGRTEGARSLGGKEGSELETSGATGK